MDLLGHLAEKARDQDPTYPESNGGPLEWKAPALLLAGLSASLNRNSLYLVRGTSRICLARR